MDLNSSQFECIQVMVYQASGMHFSENKSYLLEARIKERMKTLQLTRLSDYLVYLANDKTKQEQDLLISALTTNETFFFRDMFQIEAFADETLPYLIENKNKSGSKTLRIWSAGCSTGEEPYTISIFIHEKMKNRSNWNIEIIATDINPNVLEHARQAVYEGRSIKTIPAYYREKYFTSVENGLKVNPDIKKIIQFRQLNLSNQTAMRTIQNIDCIFCRNVLVYFDQASAAKVINNFYQSLNPGGVVFLGYSESMQRFSESFQSAKFKRAFAHIKPFQEPSSFLKASGE